MVKYILTDYINRAMSHAVYDKMADGDFVGRIAPCVGVIAFGHTLTECQEELRSTLEGWILVGLKFGDPLPVIDGLDLNQEAKREPVESV